MLRRASKTLYPPGGQDGWIQYSQLLSNLPPPSFFLSLSISPFLSRSLSLSFSFARRALQAQLDKTKNGKKPPPVQLKGDCTRPKGSLPQSAIAIILNAVFMLRRFAPAYQWNCNALSLRARLIPFGTSCCARILWELWELQSTGSSRS